METRQPLLVIQHEEGTEVDWVGEWLVAAGHQLDIRRGHDGDDVPRSLTDHSALVVLGGSMGAHEDDVHNWLGVTKELIHATVADGIPFLGICLGHQLATLALGGRVERNPDGHHIGAEPVSLTAAGGEDPLLAGLDGRPAIHYNYDVVTQAPEGASVLATMTDGRIQALRFGPKAWGVQFHPETSPQMFRTWGEEYPAFPADERARRADAADAVGDTLWDTWGTFTRRFAEIVREHRG